MVSLWNNPLLLAFIGISWSCPDDLPIFVADLEIFRFHGAPWAEASDGFENLGILATKIAGKDGYVHSGRNKKRLI